jgi:hypothetical protein
MRRRNQSEQVEPFRRRIHLPAGDHVKSMIESWALTADFEIVAPDRLPPAIQDRDADVWESLITIADAVGGTWPDRARVAAVALVAASKEAEPSLGIRLLADLRTIFGDREAMPSKAILAALHDMTESRWGDIRGKPLDERGLANRLRHYGVKPKVVRVGESTPRGYTRADLYDQWVRYLPPLGAKSATSATSDTTQINQPENVADDVADAEDVADDAQHVAAVLRMPLPKNASKTVAVADVADVVCAQCRAGGGVVPRMDGSGGLIWLHPECARFWGSPITSWDKRSVSR